jgi:hypothetical protein
VLEIKRVGPCAGHPCDNCKICQKGRCCRTDNPNYRLPELGEWDRPIYGELGVLHDDGEQVECHCCGAWFDALGMHVWKAHNLRPAEYRAIFGLGRTTGLVGPRYRKALQSMDLSHLTSGQGFPFTLAQRSAIARWPRRLETKRHVSQARRRPEALQRASAAAHNRERQRRQANTTAASQYRGVHKQNQKWVAKIGFAGKHLYLGVYATDEQAARAYDAKARELRGDQARLNFPDETAFGTMHWAKEAGGYVLTAGAYWCRVWNDAEGCWRGFVTDGQWATTQICFRSAAVARTWCEERVRVLLVPEQSRERGA